MAIWYGGCGISYGQYLQANSFVKDITGGVRESGKGLEAKISRQTKEIVANHQQLASEFGEGFDSVQETLEWGFDALEGGMQEISASMDSLHADFNYNMGLLIDQVSITNELLSNLIDKLDAIHKTLESPTLTQAREYYRIGCDRLSKGLLDKALEAFLESERKNNTDFFTQFHIGNLYLYGVDEDDNVLDLKKAKEHFLLAARYAKAETKVDASFARLAAESLLHASIAVYAQLGDKDILDDTSKTKSLLEEAKRLTLDAVRIYPQLSEGFYHVAKYSALLKEPETSIQSLQTAIIADREYAVKVDIDHAFDPIRSHVLELLARMRDAKKNECQNKLNQAPTAFKDASEWHMEESGSLSSQFAQCENDYSRAQEQFNSKTYFGFLDAISLLDSLILALPVLKSKRELELSGEVRSLLISVSVRVTHYADLPNSGEYSADVENDIQGANVLRNKAGNLLDQCNYESYKLALSTAQSAYELASSAYQKAQEERNRMIFREQMDLETKKGTWKTK